MGKSFKILGLANGSIQGNSEILLKAALQAALQAAQSSDPNTTASWIHIPSVLIPRNPRPLESAADPSMGNVPSMFTGSAQQAAIDADDRAAILNAILEADALIFSTPIYSHQPPGFLKAVTDRIMGPFTDAALAQHILEGKRAGDPLFAHQNVDERILKPRVVGFMAVGGSPLDEHVSMALPTLHQFVYPIHAKVVDQVVFKGYASPGSVIFANGGAAVGRARALGRNVASQLGRGFDEAEYLGPEPAGACPYCHLAKLDFFGGPDGRIGCIVCGARGRLVVKDGGVIGPVWERDDSWSCITMKGKAEHVDHIMAAGKAEAEALRAFSEFEETKNGLLDIGILAEPLPSMGATTETSGASF